jgi:hypothetical protein
LGGSPRSVYNPAINFTQGLDGDKMLGISTPIIDDTERDEILNALVEDYATDGWTITRVVHGEATFQKKDRLGSNSFWVGGIFWTITILLVIFTAGLWLVVIVVWYLTLKTRTVSIKIDEYGALDVT